MMESFSIEELAHRSLDQKISGPQSILSPLSSPVSAAKMQPTSDNIEFKARIFRTREQYTVSDSFDAVPSSSEYIMCQSQYFAYQREVKRFSKLEREGLLVKTRRILDDRLVRRIFAHRAWKEAGWIISRAKLFPFRLSFQRPGCIVFKIGSHY